MNKKILYSIIGLVLVGGLFSAVYAGPIINTITFVGLAIFKENAQFDKDVNIDGTLSGQTIDNLQTQIDDLPSELFSCQNGGQSCTVGVGECENSGINVCMMGTSQCSASAEASSPEICDSLDNDCDGTSDEDFDLNNNPNNCGACGLVCSSTNVNTLSCTTGVCTPFCNPGFGNCNDEQVFNDGCEELLDSNPLCASEFINLGSFSGDTGNQIVTHTSFGEKWFRLTMTEDDTSTTTCNDLGIRIEFLSNPGANYRIDARCNSCGDSPVGGNPVDRANLGFVEECPGGIPTGANDSREIFVHVFYAPTAFVSCDEWTVVFGGNNDSLETTC